MVEQFKETIKKLRKDKTWTDDKELKKQVLDSMQSQLKVLVTKIAEYERGHNDH